METWIRAHGFEGLYEVSDMGNVRRLGGSIKCKRTRPVKAVAMKKRAGYLCVSLWRGNKGYMQRLHRLVYQSFHGPIPAKMDVHHEDEIKTNNRLDNLRALTKQEHAKISPHSRGEQHFNAILTEDDVRTIRREYQRGVRGSGYVALGRKLGFRSEYVRDVIKRGAWKHVQ